MVASRSYGYTDEQMQDQYYNDQLVYMYNNNNIICDLAWQRGNAHAPHKIIEIKVKIVQVRTVYGKDRHGAPCISANLAHKRSS